MSSGQVKVVLKHSVAGTTERQRRTVKALGLGKIGSSNVLPDRPEVRGMIAAVAHLIEVSENKA